MSLGVINFSLHSITPVSTETEKKDCLFHSSVSHGARTLLSVCGVLKMPRMHAGVVAGSVAAWR